MSEKRTFVVSLPTGKKNADGEKEYIRHELSMPEYLHTVAKAKIRFPADGAGIDATFYTGCVLALQIVAKACCKDGKKFDLVKFTKSAAQNAVAAWVPVAGKSKRSNGKKRVSAVELLLADETLTPEQRKVIEGLRESKQA